MILEVSAHGNHLTCSLIVVKKTIVGVYDPTTQVAAHLMVAMMPMLMGIPLLPHFILSAFSLPWIVSRAFTAPLCLPILWLILQENLNPDIPCKTCRQLGLSKNVLCLAAHTIYVEYEFVGFVDFLRLLSSWCCRYVMPSSTKHFFLALLTFLISCLYLVRIPVDAIDSFYVWKYLFLQVFFFSGNSELVGPSGSLQKTVSSLRLEACQSELIAASASCLVFLVNFKVCSSLWRFDYLTICYFELLGHFVFNLEKLSTLTSPNISHSLFLVFSSSLRYHESNWREWLSVNCVWSTVMPPSTLEWPFHFADLKLPSCFPLVFSIPCHSPCLCQCLIAGLQCEPFCSNHLATPSALIIMASRSGVSLAHFRCAFLRILPAPYISCLSSKIWSTWIQKFLSSLPLT